MEGTKTTTQKHPKTPLQLCESAWRDVCQVELIYRDGYPKHPVIQFTNGVLKLPKDYWVAVVEALQEGRWRKASNPLPYLRSVAARNFKKLKGELARGSYAGDGKKPVDETCVSLRSPCLTLAQNGVWFDEPRSTPSPLITRHLLGQMIPESPIPSETKLEGHEQDEDDNSHDTTKFDLGAYEQWRDCQIADMHQVDWFEVAKALELDPDEQALFGVALLADEDSNHRTLLGWDYSRFDKTRKRLRRKRGALKSAINEQAKKRSRERPDTAALVPKGETTS